MVGGFVRDNAGYVGFPDALEDVFRQGRNLGHQTVHVVFPEDIFQDFPQRLGAGPLPFQETADAKADFFRHLLGQELLSENVLVEEVAAYSLGYGISKFILVLRDDSLYGRKCSEAQDVLGVQGVEQPVYGYLVGTPSYEAAEHGVENDLRPVHKSVVLRQDNNCQASNYRRLAEDQVLQYFPNT